MGAKQSERTNTTYLKLKAKTSDTDPTPFFGKSEKKGDSWEITEKFDAVDGHLKDISHDHYEYEGEQKYKCIMKLVDDDGSITHLEVNFNGILYSILNCLRGVDPDMIEINVWLGKAKVENGKEGKRYASAAVKNNGEKIGWAIEYSELPKPESIQAGKKIVKDDTNVIEYWKRVIDQEIKPRLNGEIIPVQEKSNKMPPNKAVEQEDLSNTTYTEPPTDDLPF